MNTKAEVQKLLTRMPDDCTLEDIQYRLYVMQKLQRGMEDEQNGRVVSHEEVLRRVAPWSKA